MDRMGRTDQLARCSAGRYLTFDPAEVTGCSATLYATDTRQPAQLHSLRAGRLSSPTPPHYAYVCVLRWDLWAGLSGHRPPSMWRSPEPPLGSGRPWPEGHTRGMAPVVATSKGQSRPPGRRLLINGSPILTMSIMRRFDQFSMLCRCCINYYSTLNQC